MAPGPSIFMNEKAKSQAIRLNCNIMNLNNLDFFLVDALKINFCRAFSSHKSQIPLFCFCFHLCKTVMMLFLESRSNAKKTPRTQGALSVCRILSTMAQKPRDIFEHLSMHNTRFSFTSDFLGCGCHTLLITFCSLPAHSVIPVLCPERQQRKGGRKAFDCAVVTANKSLQLPLAYKRVRVRQSCAIFTPPRNMRNQTSLKSELWGCKGWGFAYKCWSNIRCHAQPQTHMKPEHCRHSQQHYIAGCSRRSWLKEELFYLFSSAQHCPLLPVKYFWSFPMGF